MTLNIIIAACLLAGLILSLILVQHYINAAAGFTEKWCSRSDGSSDKKGDCKSILDSRFAKMFGISHADFGIMYFGGSLLLILTSQYISWLIPLLSLAAISYCIFSIFVQKYLLRQWCTLCLLVQTVVIFQAIIIIFTIFSSIKTFTFAPSNISEFLTTIGIFLIPSILWWIIRQKLVNKNAVKSKQHPLLSAQSLAKFHKQKGKLEIEPLEGDIVCKTPNLPESSNKKDKPWRVVIGIAPSCAHCGEFLNNILNLIEKDKLPIHLRIRFVVMGLDDSHDGINDFTVTESVMALANSSENNEGHAFAIEKLRSWYQEFEGKNLAAWQASFRNIKDDERNTSGVFMADNIFWLQDQNVEEIPAVFIEEQRIEPTDSAYATEVLRKLCGS